MNNLLYIYDQITELFSNLKMWKINNVGRQGKGNISVDHK